jgi:hypothetical protein
MAENRCEDCPVMERIMDDEDVGDACDNCFEYNDGPTMADGVTPLQF